MKLEVRSLTPCWMNQVVDVSLQILWVLESPELKYRAILQFLFKRGPQATHLCDSAFEHSDLVKLPLVEEHVPEVLLDV